MVRASPLGLGVFPMFLPSYHASLVKADLAIGSYGTTENDQYLLKVNVCISRVQQKQLLSSTFCIVLSHPKTRLKRSIEAHQRHDICVL